MPARQPSLALHDRRPGDGVTADEAARALRLVDVALPVPLFRTFSYAVERDFEHPLVVGSRVVVPWRSGREVGIVVETDVAPVEGVRYKPVAMVPDAEPAVSPGLLATCRWLADHYVAPLGIALRSALPAALAGAEHPDPSGRTRRTVEIEPLPSSLMAREAAFGRARKQRELYDYLESVGGRAAVEHVLERLSISESVIDGLVLRGLARVARESMDRDPFAARPPAPAAVHVPTPAQQAAISRVIGGGAGDVFLLHGVTGSGKTLVYLEVLRHVVDVARRSAIVLVPEIALTPQTVDRFRAVFGDRVAVLHSALSDGERLDAWRALRRGDKRIAVGARSAIFAPLDDLGAIIVDEEHETSYKQNETPRYHARDVAIVRARHAGAVTVLGSATPSLESWVLAQEGSYTLLSLPDRVGGGVLPEIEIVDLAAQRGAPPEHQDPSNAPSAPHHSIPSPTVSFPADREPESADSTAPTPANSPLPTTPPRPARIPAPPRVLSTPGSRDPFRRVVSEPLERAIRATLSAREQAILLLNRRGYAAFVQCTTCGDVSACPNCSISLTYHRTPERMVCHYCGHAEEVRPACARCGAATMRQRGLGTQQVERLLVERFPDARIARMDVDTTSGKWAHAEILDRVGAGEVDLLLGTQMIAKGLDFPNVTLVGVIDADVGINLPDFRAAERTFQLLAQVAGRAGRSTKAGRVIIQSRMGTHHALRCALAHDYEGFVAQELPGRASPPYPPTIRLANVVFSATAEQATADLAQQGTDWLRRLAAARTQLQLTIIGPAPCPVDRIKQRWRWHTLVKGRSGSALTRALRYFAERFEVPNRDGMRLVVDRDPVSLL
jgi:primosomal protein N' (replication factor Y)